MSPELRNTHSIFEKAHRRILEEAFPNLLADISSRTEWHGYTRPPGDFQGIPKFMARILEGVTMWESDRNPAADLWESERVTMPNFLAIKYGPEKILGYVRAEFDEARGKMKMREYDDEGKLVSGVDYRAAQGIEENDRLRIYLPSESGTFDGHEFWTSRFTDLQINSQENPEVTNQSPTTVSFKMGRLEVQITKPDGELAGATFELGDVGRENLLESLIDEEAEEAGSDFYRMVISPMRKKYGTREMSAKIRLPGIHENQLQRFLGEDSITLVCKRIIFRYDTS